MAHALRATTNHVFSREDILGRGATSEVYKGVCKRTGEIHALKIFDPRVDMTLLRREMTALKKLQHDNIVSCVSYEEELPGKRPVVVMEYCEKGSLLNILGEPEYLHGLDEDEFLRLFRHLVSGIKHLRQNGFLHRDIKPGNILLGIEEDGSYIYKFSDFGTAKPLEDDERFQSLVGTEEYLHPAIFRAAFMEPHKSRKFDFSADLWSVGATLYHAATGRVPFRPYVGRNDKLTMYNMISNKGPGVISGVQTKDKGPIDWSKDLPDTCHLSPAIKKPLALVLGHLMETDQDRMWTFEKFFAKADEILRKKPVFVFAAHTMRQFRLYLDGSQKFDNIQDEIDKETSIPPTDQLLLFGDAQVLDIIAPDDPLFRYPATSASCPIVMVPISEVHSIDLLSMCYLDDTVSGSVPSFPIALRIDEDHRISRKFCESLALLKGSIQSASEVQQLLVKTLSSCQRWTKLQTEKCESELGILQERIDDLNLIMSSEEDSNHSQQNKKQIPNLFDEVDNSVRSCNSIIQFIKDTNGQHEKQKCLADFCFTRNTCVKKATRMLELGKGLSKKFQDLRYKRNLAFHEEQLHKFDRKALENYHSSTVSLWKDTCKANMEQTHQSFMNWHRDFSQILTKLEILKKQLLELRTLVAGVARQIAATREVGEFVSVNTGSDPTRRRELSTNIDKLLGTILDLRPTSSTYITTGRHHMSSLLELTSVLPLPETEMS